MRRSSHQARRRRLPDGFMMVDVMIALAVMVVLSGLLTTSAVWSRRAADHLAETRAATAVAEAALADLAQGRAAPPGVTVVPAAVEAGPPGHRWVRVTAAVHGRSVTLFGLAQGDK